MIDCYNNLLLFLLLFIIRVSMFPCFLLIYFVIYNDYKIVNTWKYFLITFSVIIIFSYKNNGLVLII